MPDLVWNELSVVNLLSPGSPIGAGQAARVRSHMAQLVALMRVWAQAGLPRVIRIPLSIATSELAPGYSLQQWRNDPQIDRDQRQLFRLYSARTPELEDVLEEVRARGDVAEMHCEGRAARGLLAAWLLDGVSVSWDTHPVWRQANVRCVLHELGPAGDLVERPVEVPNAAYEQHIVSWLSTRRLERERHLADGRTVLERCAEWLPALRFVGSSPAQLLEWAPNREGWPFVLRSLCQLQDVCAVWGNNPFPHASISSPCSPEGSRVSSNDYLRSHREFVCEDGELRYFSWHVKHYKLNLRIHYHPDEQLRIVRIGYIGGHLPL